MIHIYTGNGKGKTTAAFGMAMRASGQSLKVAIFQFLKPKALLCGEQIAAKKIKGIRLVRFNQAHPMFEKKACNVVAVSARKDFEKTKKAILTKGYDMVVLDEIINAVDQNFISRKSLLELLRAVPQNVELVLTGRGDITSIEQYADYVTVMIDKKHPFRKRIGARRGIEY